MLFDERKLGRIAYPICKAAKSWTSLDDAGDEEKAKWFDFATVQQERAQLYMTTVWKDDVKYAKLQIVKHGHTDTLYVKADTVTSA